MTTAEARHGRHSHRGAYGLNFEGSLVGSAVSQEFFVDGAPEWPRWEVCWEPLDQADPGNSGIVDMTWSPDRATLPSRPRGYVTIDRPTARTVLHLPEHPSAAALVHPYLGSTGMIAGHWMGRAPFHAGAFELEGRAWVVQGVCGGVGFVAGSDQPGEQRPGLCAEVQGSTAQAGSAMVPGSSQLSALPSPPSAVPLDAVAGN